MTLVGRGKREQKERRERYEGKGGDYSTPDWGVFFMEFSGKGVTGRDGGSTTATTGKFAFG
jgi:hypothetical protein